MLLKFAMAFGYKRLKELKRSQYELAQQLLKHPAVESSARITGAADII
ncbi:TPA: hypothetical protein HA231_05730 [Candidatus Woesearchaeota archaeon]|nr:hypothetical protein [Candidatus Woesearchaeota archaeon]